MKFIKYIKTMLVILVSAILLTTSNICNEMAEAQPIPTSVQEITVQKEGTSSALDIVNSPKNYLNKTVIFNAKFDKFSTLGLDYKPAFKSSEEYISFLIKREDTSFDIPLSEMKLFVKRDEAEKFIDLKSNDEIQVEGTVFSDALGDPWIDVTKITLIKKAPDKDGVK